MESSQEYPLDPEVAPSAVNDQAGDVDSIHQQVVTDLSGL